VLPYLSAYQSGVAHLAFTFGRPVVATDVGDLGAVVADGETGLLVPPGDPAVLAAAIGRLLDDPDLATRMGAAGHARLARGARWDDVAARILATYRDLVRRSA
jgi:glycosyltransferase involved in cell wall biosynthesis